MVFRITSAAHILEGFFQQLENNREKPKIAGTSGE